MSAVGQERLTGNPNIGANCLDNLRNADASELYLPTQTPHLAQTFLRRSSFRQLLENSAVSAECSTSPFHLGQQFAILADEAWLRLKALKRLSLDTEGGPSLRRLRV